MAYTRIQHRRGTTAQWNQYDPILGPGEIGVDLSTKRLKMGNGSLKWSELDYFDGTAYDTAVKNGFEGTEAEWLLELVGPPAEITIGTVTTLPPGSSASASISGTAPAYTLNFDIPRGNPGTDIHFVGSVPTVGDLPDGAASNDAYIVDADGNLWVSDGNDNWTDAGQIVGPQGPQGIQGEVGNPISIKGSYNTYSELNSSVSNPQNGDAYVVTQDYHLWVWFNSQWNDYGNVVNIPHAIPITAGIVYGQTVDDSGTVGPIGATTLGHEAKSMRASVIIGKNAADGNLQQETFDANLVVVGNNAISNSLSVRDSVVVGSNALLGSGYATSQNVVVGANAASYNNGNKITAVGYQAGLYGALGTRNIYIGNTSGPQNGSSNASYNSIVGDLAFNDGSGVNNSSLGYSSLNALTFGDRNVAVGSQAGAALTSGTGNVFIGNSAGAGYTSVSDILAIDNSATTSPLIYGNFSSRSLRVNGSFHVPGVAVSSTPTTISFGNKYFVDTSSQPITLNITSATLGGEIHIFDASNKAGTNNITINANGLKINGLNESLVLDANAAAVVLVYTGSTYGWRVG